MLITRMQPETFRRICMSFDAWIVGFGLSKLVQALGMVQGPSAYGILAVVIIVDTWMLVRFFGAHGNGVVPSSG